LKDDFDAKLEDVKSKLCENKKLFKELVKEKEQYESKYDKLQCKKLLDDEQKFIQKSSKDCDKNSATVIAQINYINRYIDSEKNKMDQRKTRMEGDKAKYAEKSKD